MKNVALCAAALALLLSPTFAAAAEEALVAPVEAAAPPAELAKRWDLDLTKSSITFKGKQMDTPGFDGVITKFYPVIHFDADRLDQSKVTVDIDVTSIDAKDGERNKTLQGSEWLDAAKFPTARFETTGFTKTGENAFVADANLTIRDVTVPLQLPFTLSPMAGGIGPDRVLMQGEVTLDRSKFQLGQGDWADASVIGNDIAVQVQVTAWPAETAEAAPVAPPETVTPPNP
jgi:cytochrome b561